MTDKRFFVPYHKQSDTWLFDMRAKTRHLCEKRFVRLRLDGRAIGDKLVQTGERRHMTKSFTFWRNVGWEIKELEVK